MNDYSTPRSLTTRTASINASRPSAPPHAQRQTATAQELAAFCAGQEAISAKPNYGDSGRGVEKAPRCGFSGRRGHAGLSARARADRSGAGACPASADRSTASSSVNTLRILTDVVGEDVLIAYITPQDRNGRRLRQRRARRHHAASTRRAVGIVSRCDGRLF